MGIDKEQNSTTQLEQNKIIVKNVEKIMKARDVNATYAEKDLGLQKGAYAHAKKFVDKHETTEPTPAAANTEKGTMVTSRPYAPRVPHDVAAAKVAEVDELRKSMTLEQALLAAGVSQSNYNRWKKKLARTSGGLPAFAGNGARNVALETIQLDGGHEQPFVLAIGNAKDMQQVMGMVRDIFRGGLR